MIINTEAISEIRLAMDLIHGAEADLERVGSVSGYDLQMAKLHLARAAILCAGVPQDCLVRAAESNEVPNEVVEKLKNENPE